MDEPWLTLEIPDPVIDLDTASTREWLYISNVGPRTALDVEVQPVHRDSYVATFGGIQILRPDEKLPLQLEVRNASSRGSRILERFGTRRNFLNLIAEGTPPQPIWESSLRIAVRYRFGRNKLESTVQVHCRSLLTQRTLSIRDHQGPYLINPVQGGFCDPLTVGPLAEHLSPSQCVSSSRGGSTGRRFAIALSFAGEIRPLVEEVASALVSELGEGRVLYDRFFEAEFARPGLDVYLPQLYQDESDLLVAFLGSDYQNKPWCGLELRRIRELIKARQDARLMLLRYDDCRVDGILSIDGYVSISALTPRQIAQLIVQRYAFEQNAHVALRSKRPLSK